MYDPLAHDPQRFRVNMICPCQNDLAYGYGATIAEAGQNAVRCFRRNHGRRKPAEVVIEEVTADGTHYEEYRPMSDKRRFRLQDDRGDDVLGGAVTINNVFVSIYGTLVGGPAPDKLAVGDSCKKRYALSGQKPTVYTIVRVDDAEEVPCVS
jgi:hypothetical protein